MSWLTFFALLLLNLVVEHTVLSLLLSLLTFALLFRLIKILFAWWYQAFETTKESQSQHNQLKQGLIVLLIWSFGFGLLRESVLTFCGLIALRSCSQGFNIWH